jgi:hypothetical protein
MYSNIVYFSVKLSKSHKNRNLINQQIISYCISSGTCDDHGITLKYVNLIHILSIVQSS